MCVNKYYVINPYTKKGLYVNCGKCMACQQEKAIHRVRRIKNTITPKNECLMVTLTYSRSTAPYIDRSEAYHFSRGRVPYLNVYRDRKYRRVRVSKDYSFEYRHKDERYVVDKVPFVSECDFDKNKDLKHEVGKIGIAYYPDLQAFVARLRLNLKRLYSYEKPIKLFCASEYGSKSNRPHFHLLLFCEKGDYETLRSAICKSWPFSDLQNFPRAVEKCFRGASYCASYVNCGSSFPNFLKLYFKPKHSYSKGFGLGNAHFTLLSLKSMYDKGSFTYPYIKADKVTSSVIDKLVPAYVIHRYFPKFKAYSRIAPTALSDIIGRFGKGEYDEINRIIEPLYIAPEECRKIGVRLNNAFRRCNEELPNVFGTFDEYYRVHINVWNLYHSNLLKQHLLDESLQIFEKYDNLDIVKSQIDSGDMSFPVGFTERDFRITNPNEYPSNIHNSYLLTSHYIENDKHRRVSNCVMSTLYEEF